MRTFVACAVALACASAPAMAEEKCWTAKEMTAARVRDLQSVLMVGALQCRATEHNLLADFNQFVVAGRALIVTENDVLKARFVKLMGAKEGNRAYDSFTTALANDHSATTGRMVDFCGQAQALAVEAVAALGLAKADEALELIAERLGEHPRGVGAGCADVKPVTVVATMDPQFPRAPDGSDRTGAAGRGRVRPDRQRLHAGSGARRRRSSRRDHCRRRAAAGGAAAGRNSLKLI